MRDRRDYLIAGLAAGLLFTLGVLLGQSGDILPRAEAQDSNANSFDPTQPVNPVPGAGSGGVSINTGTPGRPGYEGGRTSAQTASDSNSNNRFVAVTSPVGSGESVLFLLDSESEQIAVYRFHRSKGLEFLAGRKIDYDLRITGYEDRSKYSREDMRRLFETQRAREAADALKDEKTK